MKGDDIANRLLDFGAQILRLASKLPADQASRHIARQLVRTGTAGGANYEEARAAESRANFVHNARHREQGGQGVALLAQAVGAGWTQRWRCRAGTAKTKGAR